MAINQLQIFNQKTSIKEIKEFMRDNQIPGISKVKKSNKDKFIKEISEYQEYLKNINKNNSFSIFPSQDPTEFDCMKCKTHHESTENYDFMNDEEEGYQVLFFECKNCGYKYCVTIYD